MTSFARLIDDSNPRLRNRLNALGQAIDFDSLVTNFVANNAVTVDLTKANHQAIDASAESATYAITLTVPAGVSSGALQIQHGATPQAVTWAASSGTVTWATTEPDLATDQANSQRHVSWFFDGTNTTLFSTVSAEVQGLTAWVNVQNYGADGVASETPDNDAIVAAIAALPAAGGTLYFPAGVYTIGDPQTETEIVLPSNTRMIGDGPGTVIRPTKTQWNDKAAPTNFYGIINLMHDGASDNCSISNILFDGRAAEIAAEQDPSALPWHVNYIPKLIYFAKPGGSTRGPINCSITKTWGRNAGAEAYWGSVGDSLFADNDLRDCGIGDLTTGTGSGETEWPALTALQPNGVRLRLIGNHVENCGSGISSTADDHMIVNNEIVDVLKDSIGLGDGGLYENGLIANNVIVRTATDIAGKCITLLGGRFDPDPAQVLEGLYNVIGNVITIHGDQTKQPVVGISATTGRNVNIADNTIVINDHGIAIKLETGTKQIRAKVSDNVVFGKDIVQSPTYTTIGINAQVNNENDIDLQSSNNKVYGITRSDADYAYRYSNKAGQTGKMRGDVSGDWSDGGGHLYAYDVDTNVQWNYSDIANQRVSLVMDPNDALPLHDQFAANAFSPTPYAGGVRNLAGVAKTLDLTEWTGPYQNRVKVTFSNGSELATITGGSAGSILIIEFVGDANARTWTVEHGTGNIWLLSEANKTFTHSTAAATRGPGRLQLIQDDDGQWHQL